MMSKSPVRPEDILPDGVDSTQINGVTVRKGTIAAFLTNIDLFECLSATEQQKHEALAEIKKLAPMVKTIGLHKHVLFKNPIIQHIMEECV